MRRLFVVWLVLGWVLGLVGCAAENGSEKTAETQAVRGIKVEFREAADTEHPGYLRMNLSGTARFLYVAETPVMTTDAIASAELDTLDGGQPRVTLNLTESGRQTFAELTRSRVGKRVAIVVDGLLLSAPMVMAEINTGRAVIEGRFDLEEANRIIRGINGQ